MRIFEFDDILILEKCYPIIKEMNLVIKNSRLELDNETSKKFINKLKKILPELGIIQEENCKISKIGVKSVGIEQDNDKCKVNKSCNKRFKKIEQSLENFKDSCNERFEKLEHKLEVEISNLKHEISELKQLFISLRELIIKK